MDVDFITSMIQLYLANEINSRDPKKNVYQLPKIFKIRICLPNNILIRNKLDLIPLQLLELLYRVIVIRNIWYTLLPHVCD